MAKLFHKTMHSKASNGDMLEKATRHDQYIKRAIKVAKKNLFLLLLMIAVFVLFWYPLFLLTLSDPLFKAHVSY